MQKNPSNTTTNFTLYRDYTIGSKAFSEEIVKDANPQVVLKQAKKLGDNEVWMIIESRVWACSDRSYNERNARLGYQE